MKVIWIDPGETVGWVTANVSTIHQPSFEIEEFGMDSMQTFSLNLLHHADEYDYIGFETYTIRPDKLRAHAGSDVPTLQQVGMIRIALWEGQRLRGDGFPQIVDQDPGYKTKGQGAMKLFFTPTEIAAVKEGLAGKHDDGHYADAMLHLAAWWFGWVYEGKR